MSVRSRRIVLSAEARVDLSDLLLYTERRWGNRQRRDYRRTLSDAFLELARFPHMGQSRPDFGPEFRSFRVRQHIVVYRVTDTEVRIDRLLHVSRDAGAEMETAPE